VRQAEGRKYYLSVQGVSARINKVNVN